MPNSEIKYILDKFKTDAKIQKIRMANMNTHVAVIVNRGKIIATAVNRIGYRNENSQSYYNTYLHTEKNKHAEELAVKALGNYNRLRNSDMYILRFGRGQNYENYSNSKPCAKCHCFLNKCIKDNKLRRVFYTM